jgi:hypothetical protein
VLNANFSNISAISWCNIRTGLGDMEPKMKAAILKMRKLDRILSKKIKREKEVKRDRIILERRYSQTCPCGHLY